MDFAPIVPWLGAAALLISLGTSLTAFFRSGTKENATKLADHGARIAAIEGELRHMPNQSAVHEMQLTLKDMQIEIVKIASSAEQSARTSSRVEAYLLEHGK